MTSELKPLRVRPGELARLADRPTRIAPLYDGKADYEDRLRDRVKAIAKLQQALFAERRHALLVILQAMDAGGKDGAVRHVFSGVNPQGCQVTSFGPPSREELQHDFLWRTARHLPPRGVIGVFNRSWYEEVLAVRAHPDLLAAEGLAPVPDADTLWEGRFRSINDHEAHLHRSGTRVLKLFLHLSRDEQRRRFLRRLKRPDKHWKIDPADLDDRTRWDDYLQAYEAALGATSTKHAPWLALPADDKRTARLLVAEAVLHALQDLHPAYPRDPAAEDRLETFKRRLDAEDGGRPA